MGKTSPDPFGISFKPVPAVEVWIGAPPGTQHHPDVLVPMVDEFLDLLIEYGYNDIFSSIDEPCRYRNTEVGRAALTAALRHESLGFLRAYWSDRTVSYGNLGWSTLLFHRDRELPFAEAARIEMTLFVQPPHKINVALTQAISFIERWFQPLNAAAACVRVTGDGTGVPYIDYNNDRNAPLLAWNDIRLCARGVFWGNALGRDMCAILGGQQRMLKEAPVAVARPLGDGVWLQLSETPPTEMAIVDRLREYLTPLLDWTKDDVQRDYWIDPETGLRRPLRQNFPRRERPSLPPLLADLVRAISDGEIPGPLIPIELLYDKDYDDLGIDDDIEFGINVYLAAPPTAKQRTVLIDAMDAWQSTEVNEAFGSRGFALDHVYYPTVTDRVFRWRFGADDFEYKRALPVLQAWLATLPGVNVTRLVIGTEILG